MDDNQYFNIGGGSGMGYFLVCCNGVVVKIFVIGDQNDIKVEGDVLVSMREMVIMKVVRIIEQGSCF